MHCIKVQGFLVLKINRKFINYNTNSNNFNKMHNNDSNRNSRSPNSRSMQPNKGFTKEYVEKMKEN